MEHPLRSPHPNQIRFYRRRNNLKLCDVARLAGLRDVAHVAQWEHGKKLPRLENALKLSIVIRCPVEVLFFDLFSELRKDINERRSSVTPPHHA